MKIIHLMRRIFGINLIVYKITLLEESISNLLGRTTLSTIQVDDGAHSFNEFIVNARAKSIIDLLQIQTPVGKNVIRIGSDSDGGYIFMDDLSAKDLFISAGIADDFNVDLQVVDKVGKLIMIDPSIDPVLFPQDHQEFIQLPLAPKGIKNSISLDQILSENEFKDSILKIDIEGAEWAIFAEFDQEKYKSFRQIVMEVHWLSNVNDNALHEIKMQALTKLNKYHQIISVHVNNYGEYRIMGGVPIPDVVEITYVRKTDYEFIPGFSNEIRSLMRANNPAKPEIEVWWA